MNSFKLQHNEVSSGINCDLFGIKLLVFTNRAINKEQIQKTMSLTNDSICDKDFQTFNPNYELLSKLFSEQGNFLEACFKNTHNHINDMYFLNDTILLFLNQLKCLFELMGEKVKGKESVIKPDTKKKFLTELDRIRGNVMEKWSKVNYSTDQNTFNQNVNLIDVKISESNRNELTDKLKINDESKIVDLSIGKKKKTLGTDDDDQSEKKKIYDSNYKDKHQLKTELEKDALISFSTNIPLLNQDKLNLLDSHQLQDVVFNEITSLDDQFIIDNRQNINQNRIQSSKIGAAKHLYKKKHTCDSNFKKTVNNVKILNEVSNDHCDQLDYMKNDWKCIFCNQTYTQKNSLKRHIRSHYGEKPFPCEFCGKCFADKQRLLIHFRIHTGEKPFSCSICNRQFTQKSTVKRHLNVHFRSNGESVESDPQSIEKYIVAQMKLPEKDAKSRESKLNGLNARCKNKMFSNRRKTIVQCAKTFFEQVKEGL